MGKHTSFRFLLRLDDDVLDMLQSYMRLAGLCRTAAVNSALRIGLWAIAAKHGAAEEKSTPRAKKDVDSS